MGWWITLGVVVLLAVLPLGVSAKYNSEGVLVRVILGPVKFTVFPRPSKPKKAKKKKTEQPEQQPTPPEEQEAAQHVLEPAKQPSRKQLADPAAKNPPPPPKETKPKEKGGSLLDFLPLVKLVFQFLGDFRRKLRLDVLEVKLIMAGGDPANLAINYGRAWAAVGNLLPQLDRLFVIKKRDIEVECDFTASETLVIARLDLTITLGRILALVFGYAIRALIIYLKIRKKRKGGAAI